MLRNLLKDWLAAFLLSVAVGCISGGMISNPLARTV
jgi:hypothetical protein